LGVLKDPAKVYKAVIRSVSNKFEVLLNTLLYKKIKINFVIYYRNIKIPSSMKLVWLECGFNIL
jgi:hypothetical protein